MFGRIEQHQLPSKTDSVEIFKKNGTTAVTDNNFNNNVKIHFHKNPNRSSRVKSRTSVVANNSSKPQATRLIEESSRQAAILNSDSVEVGRANQSLA